MQLAISISVGDPLTLPINYNHIIQAIIYNAMGKAEYSKYMHDSGFAYEKRAYKLFTFGRLLGKCGVKNKQITFFDEFQLEVRSPDPFMIRIVQQSIEKNGVCFGERKISNIETECKDRRVETSAILVKMNSPVTVYSTDPDTKKTYHYSPFDEMFNYMICDNLYRKYNACYGTDVENEIRIFPYAVEEKDRVVTSFKGNYITAYRGQYIIAGERKYLDFLYQTGLGSKNSQGFGMFDILEEDQGEYY